jgi:hypothetical protein
MERRKTASTIADEHKTLDIYDVSKEFAEESEKARAKGDVSRCR